MGKPFWHTDLEVKQKILEKARECSKEIDLANELAGALLYANIADYLATSLLESLIEISEVAVKMYYLGDISVKVKAKRKNLTLGEATEELKNFDFSDKEEIIDTLQKINKARIPVMHHIAKTPPSKMDKLDEAAGSLAESTERLVVLMDELNTKMPPKNLLDIISVKHPES